MRAAIYRGNGRLSVEERPVPEIGPGELLVRVRACGLCGSDLMRWYQDPRAPMVMGHEPAGEVVEAGAGAHQRVGSRVFVHHHVPCMACERCRAGRHTLCETFRRTSLDPGGLAEYVRVPAPNAPLVDALATTELLVTLSENAARDSTAADGVVLHASPNQLAAFSADTGAVLWKQPKKYLQHLWYALHRALRLSLPR